MSRDFSPRQCWIANAATISPERPYGIYLENILWKHRDGESWAYTDEELEDRRRHKHLAVTGCDIYGRIRKILSEEEFEKLEKTLGEMIEADASGKDMSAFPKEMTDWYHDRHGHYYHEPNDEEFMAYILSGKER